MGNLVSAARLYEKLGDPALRIVDCRFYLADPEAGYRAFVKAHIPGAVYMDLDRDLSDAAPPGVSGGRHPLPSMTRFAARLAALGISNDSKVVVYDDRGGAIASRLWWMLRYVGHEQVWVLDGGLQAWTKAGLALEDGPAKPEAARFSVDVQEHMVVDRKTVSTKRSRRGVLLVDARSPERYRGESEPMDLKAGHIPRAVNLPYTESLENGHFQSADVLRRRFALAQSADEVYVYCGSGVTACHIILAIEEAGLPLAKLYVGSWSDWSSNDDAPIATGDEE